MNGSRRSTERGVSLVEALVALAVMAFGMLGVVGIQATLRHNADVSRQRSEAVRVAQARIEQLRAYPSVNAASGAGFPNILTAPAELIATSNANADYRLHQTVADHVSDIVPDAAGARGKAVLVEVKWKDRTGTSATDNQSVQFGTLIARVPPELAGSLALPGDATLLGTPSFRHPAIPLEAEAMAGDPTRSSFTIRDTTISYVFSNTTGEIVSTCTAVGNCTPASAYLLSGHVRFATGLGRAPDATDAEIPPGPQLPQAASPLPATATGSGYVRVLRNDGEPDVSCHHRTEAGGAYVAYYCAIPYTAVDRVWSGRSIVDVPNLAASAPVDTRTSATHFRVCRYAPIESPTRNIDHPANYANVAGPLTNQNFLVIDAGDGTVARDCPLDDLTTPLDTDTWLHQP